MTSQRAQRRILALQSQIKFQHSSNSAWRRQRYNLAMVS
ncbi:hypothetical protein N825_06690 [Skermanella stibiiresistens SB22]|uniref:Uncharacterized protein n=1 Tax=Skermanella stibiiresistens SB22 TaxID=1385369 RepID=W9H084_9PROT|nr:hypothetical protein N825_06690 [Skermanella stibiiresistens SB22]